MTHFRTALFMAGVSALSACNSSSSEVDPSLAVAQAELSEAEGGIMPDALLPKVLPIPLDGEKPGSAEDAAAEVAAAVPGAFSPEGCATAEVDGVAVTYTLSGCMPTHGMGKELKEHHGGENRHQMTATFTLTFSETDAGYGIAITGSRGNGDDENLTIEGDATLDFDGTTRILEVTTTATGTGRHGETVTKTAHHVRGFDTDTQCYTLDGVWKTVTSDDTDERSVAGFKQCADVCPESGTVVGDGRMGGRHGKHHGRGHHRDDGDDTTDSSVAGAAGASSANTDSGGSSAGGDSSVAGSSAGGASATSTADDDDIIVTLTFDGSAAAAWTSSNEQSGTLTLDCTPAE